MKAEGIRIYTIIFGATPGRRRADALPQLRDDRRRCTTTRRTTRELATVFRAIGGELANLRIVE